jgi:hypothetical protein
MNFSHVTPSLPVQPSSHYLQPALLMNCSQADAFRPEAVVVVEAEAEVIGDLLALAVVSASGRSRSRPRR